MVQTRRLLDKDGARPTCAYVAAIILVSRNRPRGFRVASGPRALSGVPATPGHDVAIVVGLEAPLEA